MSKGLVSPLGNYPNDWKIVHLRDITTKIGSGATPTGGQDTYLCYRENFALVRSQNVFDRRFDENGLAFITDKQAQDLIGVSLIKGDILLNITGDGITFSRSCIIPERILPAVVNQHVSIIRVDESQADSGYILSYLTHPSIKKYIESFNAGGSRRAITKGHIESFVIPLPSLPTQHAIARILGSLDDKIELNRKMNETLEAMARAIFQSWFVDFDPVRAKAEEHDTGLPAEIEVLFPDGFDEVDGREVPRGWRIITIGECVNLIKGRSYTSEELQESKTALVTLKSFLRGGGYRHDGLKPFTGKYDPEQIVKTGELIISFTDVTQAAEVIGKPAIVSDNPDFDILVASLDVGIVRPKYNSVSTIFLYLLFGTEDYQSHIYGYCSGTTVLHLDKSGIPKYEFICPPPPLMDLFSKNVSHIFNLIENNDQQSRTLAQIRDAVLPKLMSLELGVKVES